MKNNTVFSITPEALKKGFWARPGRPVKNAGFWQTPAQSSRTVVPVAFQEETVSSRVTVVQQKESAMVSTSRESGPTSRATWFQRPLRVDGLNFDEAFLVEDQGEQVFGLVQVAKKAAKKFSSKPIPTQPSALVLAAREAAAKQLAAKAKASVVPVPAVQAPVAVAVATAIPVATSAPVAQSVTPERVSKAPPKSNKPKPRVYGTGELYKLSL